MPDYEQAIFISYAWGEETHEREIIVNQLDQSLRKRGLKIVRDKRDLGYKGSIGKFMERIGEGNCVIVVISDKYLRSKNCMFELVEIAENKQFADRIFPIILSDAKIYDPVDRIDYVQYWEQEKAKLNEKIRVLSDFSNLQGIQEELNNYDRFRDEIDRLTFLLKDMNALSPSIHRDSDFNDLYTAIEKRMKEDLAIPHNTPPLELQPFEPDTVLIPEGRFWIGRDPGERIPVYDTPRHEVYLPAYRISRYPVRNREYEEFISQTGKNVLPVMGWSGRRPKEGHQNEPVRGITWEDAREYCKWLSEKTNRKYDLPNEAQLEKAYQGAYGCDDILEDIYLWTCTLWGEDPTAPDGKYRYPWQKDDGRNNLNANSQIRRVVCRYKKAAGAERSQLNSRTGQFPRKPSLPERYSFRVVMGV